MLKNKKLLFLGAGSMAEAMIAGMIKTNKVRSTDITVSNRSNIDRLKELNQTYGINAVSRESLDFKSFDIIILAMKPNNAEVALQSIQTYIQPQQLIFSVLAGISTSFIEQFLPLEQQVIRVMPNTSSTIGESATAMAAGTYTTEQSMQLAKELFQCIGKVYIIEEEKMDIFTGIAGSGPAYLYYLMEHMEEIGMQAGLPEQTAREIIAQTILGAAKMVQEQNESPTILRNNVTSPNGTTAAGLQALETNGGGKAISEAVKHATERSKSLRSELEKTTI